MRHVNRLAGVAFIAACGLSAAFAAGPATRQAAQAPTPPASAQQAPAAGGVMGYGVKMGGFFNDEHQQVARKYFSKYAKGKACPEGMERNAKHVCKPPVEGRYWAVGQSLRKEVDTYPVPEQLAAQLPPPPAGYEYVRAGEDILLKTKGGMNLVVDILENVTS